MKKLLLTLAITLASTVDAKDYADYQIERIITDGGYFSAYCIQDYVFIRGIDGSLTQVFRRGSETMEIEAQPMKCNEYKKNRGYNTK